MFSHFRFGFIKEAIQKYIKKIKPHLINVNMNEGKLEKSKWTYVKHWEKVLPQELTRGRGKYSSDKIGSPKQTARATLSLADARY